jgi:hypothetical protein
MSTTPAPVERKLDLRAKRVTNLRWKENLNHLVPTPKNRVGAFLSQRNPFTGFVKREKQTIFFSPLD